MTADDPVLRHIQVRQSVEVLTRTSEVKEMDRRSLRRQSARGSYNLRIGLEALAKGGEEDAINVRYCCVIVI